MQKLRPVRLSAFLVALVGVIACSVWAHQLHAGASGAHADSRVQVVGPSQGSVSIAMPGSLRFAELPPPKPGARLQGQSVVPMETALDIALQNYNPLNTFPDARIQAKLGYFSNDGYYKLSASGRELVIQNRPSWIFTFTGVAVPMSVPRGFSGTFTHHEMNVVVDAVTGQYIQMFNYQ